MSLKEVGVVFIFCNKTFTKKHNRVLTFFEIENRLILKSKKSIFFNGGKKFDALLASKK